MSEIRNNSESPHPTSAQIDAAVRKAMREAVLRHARLGNPVCTWRDGKVVWLSPQEIFDLFASETPAS